MTYKIEDIVWSEMPEGAVEFSLEDYDYFFTWYNDNNYYMSNALKKWQNNYVDDGRERYKVKDYLPSPTNLKMSDKEKVEHFLKELSELSNKYKIEIYSCGCCGSPNLGLEDIVVGGCYTVNKDNEYGRGE